jgi:hypothetical protein
MDTGYNVLMAGKLSWKVIKEKTIYSTPWCKLKEETIRDYKSDLENLVKLIKDPEIDLYAKAANGNGQTYLRELLLVADNTVYHIGEFSILRLVMWTWGKRFDNEY